MTNVTLVQALAVIDHALEHAAEVAMKPLAVAVVDANAHLIAFKRQDQQSVLRSDIATGKAWAAMAAGMGGRSLVRRASAQPLFYQALLALSDRRMVPGVGGVLIRDGEGSIIGAVGVSGDTADHDEACAIIGIERAGFVADAGTTS